jgi:redox-sensing transcriptional repressor
MSQDRPAGVAGRTGAVPALPDLPEATVARLPEYLRALHHLAEAGNDTVSSEGLAAAAGVNSAKLRKDLSHLGSYGTRGVGYDVALLVDQIEYVLGLTQRRAVALVGVGNLGHALSGYAGFATRGFRIAALFDADPARVGERINGVLVRHIDDLERTVAEEAITIGVIATPAAAAQQVAAQLVAAGVTSILNFAPCVLSVPDGVDVRKVDLAIELQILSFHEHRKSSLTSLPATAGAGLAAVPAGLAATGTTDAAPAPHRRPSSHPDTPPPRIRRAAPDAPPAGVRRPADPDAEAVGT